MVLVRVRVRFILIQIGLKIKSGHVVYVFFILIRGTVWWYIVIHVGCYIRNI